MGAGFASTEAMGASLSAGDDIGGNDTDGTDEIGVAIGGAIGAEGVGVGSGIVMGAEGVGTRRGASVGANAGTGVGGTTRVGFSMGAVIPAIGTIGAAVALRGGCWAAAMVAVPQAMTNAASQRACRSRLLNTVIAIPPATHVADRHTQESS